MNVGMVGDIADFGSRRPPVFIASAVATGMGSPDQSFLDRIRRPEYTGENRCLPCTALNVAIAFLATALAAPLGPVAVVVVFLASMGSIYFRGYLIPGTPTLTKRYLPDPILELFDKGPSGPREGWEEADEPVVAETSETAESRDAADTDASRRATVDESADTDETTETDEATEADETTETDETTAEDDPEFETVERIRNRRENSVEPVEFLLDVGAVVRTEGIEELAFDEAFADAVAGHVERLDPGSVPPEVLGELFDVDPAELEFKDRSYPAITVRRRVRKWPGDGAYLADVASHVALAERTERWLDVPVEQRLLILQSLRSFHTACPACGGDLAATAGTVESCCQAHEVVAIRCDDCGEHVLELDPEEVETAGPDTGITP